MLVMGLFVLGIIDPEGRVKADGWMDGLQVDEIHLVNDNEVDLEYGVEVDGVWNEMK